VIQGFERHEQVRAQLAALRAERRQHAHNKQLVKIVDAQLAIFEKEDARFRALDAERLAREAEQLQAAADTAVGLVP